MRLTLRTLLAYLDNVLEPADANVLSEKVAKGRVARELIERIQRVSRDSRLSAPKIGAPDSANDPNPVAEYLDNTLKAETIGSFEQKCLADDARLAEVAACHRILTAVLTSPAVVPNGLRNRMLNLPGTMSDGPGADNGTDLTDVVEPIFHLPRTVDIGGKQVRVDVPHHKPVNGASPVVTDTKRPIPSAGLEIDDNLASHVPEYLRGGSGRDWTTPIMIGGLVTALFFAAWMSLGSWEDLQSLLKPDNRPPAVAEAEPVASPPLAPAMVPPVLVDETKPVDNEPPQSAVKLEDNPIAMVAPVQLPASLETETKTPDAPASVLPTTTNETPKMDSSEIKEVVVAPAVIAPPIANPPPAELNAPSPARKSSLVRWLPSSEAAKRSLVLVRPSDDAQLGQPARLAPEQAAFVDDLIVVPAAMRTELQIGSDVRWTVADESILIVRDAIDSETPAIEMKLGRAMLETTAGPRTLQLRTPQRTINLNLKEAGSLVAVELRYERRRGFRLDPTGVLGTDGTASTPAEPILRILQVRGTSRVGTSGQDPMDLEVADGVEWASSEPAKRWSIDEVPWWYENAAPRTIDKQAADDLFEAASALAENASMSDFLEQASVHRLVEIAALAMRTRMLLGRFDRVVGTNGFISNDRTRPHRAVVLDSLFQSTAAHPDGVKLLRESIVEADPARALRLLDLASLPSDAQLAEGTDKRLVEALGSPFLDERVLAINLLSTIVGKEFGYQPDRPSPESKLTWKRQLDQGKIRWGKK